MICKYCGSQYTGNRCPACGKVLPLVKRSTDIDILMSGSSPVPDERTFAQGLKEGLQKGLKEGYDNGYGEGHEAGYKEGLAAQEVPKPSRPQFSRFKVIAILCAAVLVVSVASGLIGNGIGYSNGLKKGTSAGFAQGKEEGRKEGKEEGKEEGLRIAASTFEPQLAEQYRQGVEKGKAEGYQAGYGAAAKSVATPEAEPTPSATPTAEPATIPTPDSMLQFLFPYSREKNEGEYDPVVKKIQTQLKEMGYKADGKLIQDDGMYGQKTEIAIKQFQKNKNLPVTGIVDVDTYQSLFPDEVIPNDPAIEEAAAGASASPGLTDSDHEPAVPTPGASASPSPSPAAAETGTPMADTEATGDDSETVKEERVPTEQL